MQQSYVTSLFFLQILLYIGTLRLYILLFVETTVLTNYSATIS